MSVRYLRAMRTGVRRTRADDALRTRPLQRRIFLLSLRHARPGAAHALAVSRSGHPGFDPDLASEYSTLIEQHYSRCDKLLAPVLDKMDGNTLLIVLSDHGFNTFRRAFDTNTWLWQNGLLALKNGRSRAKNQAKASQQWIGRELTRTPWDWEEFT